MRILAVATTANTIIGIGITATNGTGWCGIGQYTLALNKLNRRANDG